MFDKATTAADLRNAALVMDHLGKTEDQYVDQNTASVCLDGAIRLATDYQLLTLADGTFDYDYYRGPIGSRRHEAALRALIPLLPDRCILSSPWHIGHAELRDETCVFHYSDFVCDGKDGAVAVLIEAAEKLEANL